jgi:hypothetical protein
VSIVPIYRHFPLIPIGGNSYWLQILHIIWLPQEKSLLNLVIINHSRIVNHPEKVCYRPTLASFIEGANQEPPGVIICLLGTILNEENFILDTQQSHITIQPWTCS